MKLYECNYFVVLSHRSKLSKTFPNNPARSPQSPISEEAEGKAFTKQSRNIARLLWIASLRSQ
jgi:hypothetical protein